MGRIWLHKSPVKTQHRKNGGLEMERKKLDFCQGWLFRKTGADAWEPVTLPHTWNAQDGQDGGNNY